MFNITAFEVDFKKGGKIKSPETLVSFKAISV
jgi:hypothetical protein